MSRDAFKSQGLILHDALAGEQEDIRNLCQFGWMEWMHYRDDKNNFPDHKERQRKELGHSKGVCNMMCQWKLKRSVVVIVRSTLSPITVAEKNIRVEEDRQKLFPCILHKRVHTSQTPAGTLIPSNRKANSKPYENDEESSKAVIEIEVTACDNKEVNHQPYRGKVKAITLQHDGIIIITCNENTILNTLTYDVEFDMVMSGNI